MKTRVTLAALAAALLLVPIAVFAADKPKANAPAVVLEYFENASGNMFIKDKAGKDVDFDIGTRILPGWTVVTDKGDVAELKLDPNGTILKISQNTNFKIESLQTAPGESNTFSIALGKFRSVAGKATGQEKYIVKGPSAVCGVRGTDFGMDVIPGQQEAAFVLDGLIDFTNAAGDTIQIGKGLMADTFAQAFKAIEIPADYMKSLLQDLNFSKLNPLAVPGHEAAPAADTGQATQPAEPAPTTPPAPMKTSFMDDVMAKLREILGMEIGSVTINSVTYAKVVIQPQFKLGALKLGLYLPIIYTGDMFNPADYYKPAGNNEWSFGFDKAQAGAPWYDIALDAASDVILKIKYLEWGSQRDPFFFKLGNLEDITVGHGLIMRNFANDADFPSVRRVGLNLGLDFGGIGFEAMVNDAVAPDVAGGRLYFRPIPGYKGALGMTVVADINPSRGFQYTSYSATDTGQPIFFNPGLDLDLPVVESDPFSIVGFADVAGMIPYFQSAPNTALVSSLPGAGGTAIQQGLALNAMWDSNTLRNYGFAAGLFGNILMVDYRLEYRYFTGTFRPAFYDTLYERNRSKYVVDVLTYLSNPAAAAYNNLQMGVYGEGGFKLEHIVSFSMGYFWPWALDSAGKVVPGADDHLLFTFTLEKGVIPVVNIWGSVTYERDQFVPLLMGGSALTLFDAHTIVKAEIQYPVAPTLDVVLFYTTTAHRNPDGSVQYKSVTDLLPVLDTTLSIETRVHF